MGAVISNDGIATRAIRADLESLKLCRQEQASSAGDSKLQLGSDLLFESSLYLRVLLELPTGLHANHCAYALYGVDKELVKRTKHGKLSFREIGRKLALVGARAKFQYSHLLTLETFMRFAKVILAVSTLALSSAVCQASNFSFTGNFSGINDVQLFTFSVGSGSNVVLRSYGYAGGTNAAGSLIARGGFDPILALFQGTGPSALEIGQNDDGGCGTVGQDTVTGACYDTYLAVNGLTAGTYTVSIQDYANFANGPTLGAGFNGHALTGGTFIDATGHNRDSHWAFDVLGVQSATTPPTSPVPEPASIALLGSGVLGLANMVRRRMKA